MKKKFLFLFVSLTLILAYTCSNVVYALVKPRPAIGLVSSKYVEVGGTVSYPLKIYNSATSVNIQPSDVQITGATADITILGSGNSERTIVLSNIQGAVGSECYISHISEGIASNEKGSSVVMNLKSDSFYIVASSSPAPSTPENNNNNESNGGNYYYNQQTETNNEESTPENPETEEKDETAPTMEIGNLSKTSCGLGEEISFDVSYKDDKEIGSITLENKDITLYGFKADISISGDGNKRTVTLSNISGNLGGLKYVHIASETASDKAGNKVKEDGKTGMFKVVDSSTKSRADDWIENPNTGK